MLVVAVVIGDVVGALATAVAIAAVAIAVVAVVVAAVAVVALVAVVSTPAVVHKAVRDNTCSKLVLGDITK